MAAAASSRDDKRLIAGPPKSGPVEPTGPPVRCPEMAGSGRSADRSILAGTRTRDSRRYRVRRRPVPGSSPLAPCWGSALAGLGRMAPQRRRSHPVPGTRAPHLTDRGEDESRPGFRLLLKGGMGTEDLDDGNGIMGGSSKACRTLYSLKISKSNVRRYSIPFGKRHAFYFHGIS